MTRLHRLTQSGCNTGTYIPIHIHITMQTHADKDTYTHIKIAYTNILIYTVHVASYICTTNKYVYSYI